MKKNAELQYDVKQERYSKGSSGNSLLVLDGRRGGLYVRPQLAMISAHFGRG